MAPTDHLADPVAIDVTGCRAPSVKTRQDWAACSALGLVPWGGRGAQQWATGPDGKYHQVRIYRNAGRAEHLCNGQVAVFTNEFDSLSTLFDQEDQ